MSKKVIEVATEVELPTLLAPTDPAVVPTNKQVEGYLTDGYTLADLRTRSRDEAKEAAADARKDGKLLTAYITLHQGWFSFFYKVAPPTEVKVARVARQDTPVSFEGLEFGSVREARAFARRLLDEARNVEYSADVAARS